MKRFAVAVLFIVALTGSTCSQDEGLALMNGCAAATSGIKMATVLKAQGKLSAVQIARVDDAIRTLRPICGGEAIINPTAALNLLEQQLLILNGAVVSPGSML